MKKVSAQEIARYLDLSVQRVHILINRGIIPRSTCRGRYDLLMAIHGYCRYLRKNFCRHPKAGNSLNDIVERLKKGNDDDSE